MIQTPVGQKCRDCARVVRSPIYTVKGAALFRSVAVAVVGGLVTGLVWGLLLIPIGVGFGFFSIFLGAGLAWAFTKWLEWASGRKRGPTMIALAIAGIGIAWSVTFVLAPGAAYFGLLAVGVGIYISYQNLK
jgi:hypothetical protein